MIHAPGGKYLYQIKYEVQLFPFFPLRIFIEYSIKTSFDVSSKIWSRNRTKGNEMKNEKHVAEDSFNASVLQCLRELKIY